MCSLNKAQDIKAGRPKCSPTVHLIVLDLYLGTVSLGYIWDRATIRYHAMGWGYIKVSSYWARLHLCIVLYLESCYNRVSCYSGPGYNKVQCYRARLRVVIKVLFGTRLQ